MHDGAGDDNWETWEGEWVEEEDDDSPPITSPHAVARRMTEETFSEGDPQREGNDPSTFSSTVCSLRSSVCTICIRATFDVFVF